MPDALSIFKEELESARSLNFLFLFLKRQMPSPFNYDDLLRSQIVYSVSAFDKLVHDIIRNQMVRCFLGKRPATSKYLTETISLDLHQKLLTATLPPKEVVFEHEIVAKLARLSFQDPDKVAEGLALVWDEPYKWDAIAAGMGQPSKDVRTRLKLIAARRNAIVHEADINPMSHTKNPVNDREADEVTDFISLCGQTIFRLVM